MYTYIGAKPSQWYRDNESRRELGVRHVVSSGSVRPEEAVL